MVNLTIDGRRVGVPPGTTVLEAAQWLGIRIPTMCHVPGIEPGTGCFLCAVQIEGRRTLSPACGMPVAEGMVVATGSEDVRTARKMALELLLSDHAGECVAPCAAQCPAGLDIPGFVYGIATGDNVRAMEVIAERLALPGSLGRICPRLCERQCRRSDLDQGLAIGALHRYVADLRLAGRRPAPPSTGKRVAIVGAGPAGLAAAYYLAKNGHACTLYDAHPLPAHLRRIQQHRREPSHLPPLILQQDHPVLLSEVAPKPFSSHAREMLLHQREHEGALGAGHIGLRQQAAFHNTATSGCGMRPSSAGGWSRSWSK